MSKHDDPAAERAAMREAAKRETRLFGMLDQIASAEAARNLASTTIDKLWNQVRLEGFDVSEARRTHLSRLLSRRR